jgi:hypothetical protein
LISSFLTGRTAILQADDGGTLHHEIAIGCPQGSVLSPFLWNTVIDNPIRRTYPFSYKFIAFADDITILSAHEDPIVATAQLQRMTDRVVLDTGQLLIDINAGKTSFLIFSRTKVAPPTLHLVINSTQVSTSNHCRYLGLEIDNRLT